MTIRVKLKDIMEGIEFQSEENKSHLTRIPLLTK